MENHTQVKLNIAICDDEPASVQKMAQMCQEILGGSYEIDLETAVSAHELLKKAVPFQIALLDVQMPEISGMELARILLSRNPSCRILFFSGYTNIVSDVYDVPHLCLILKDQLEEKLPRHLKRAASLAAEDCGKTIGILIGKQVRELSLSEVVSMERRAHITFISCSDGSQLQTKEKLVDILKRIDSSRFIRCHISYAVNLSYVKKEEGSGFRMKTGDWIPISRPHQQACKEAFWQCLSEQI